MKIMDHLRREGKHVLRSREKELTGWRRPLRRIADLVRFCYRRLKSENAPAMSAALSFRTLFALIPALVLAGVLLKPFGLVTDASNFLSNFLSTFGIEQIVVSREPTRAPGAPRDDFDEPPVEILMLSEQIEKMVGSVERKITFGRVGPIGVVLLIWTVMTLLTTTERSLNRVFGARRIRPFGKRMLLYWSVVTLCPLLLITAVYVGEIGVQGIGNMPVLRYLAAMVEWAAPAAVGVLTLAIVYRLMPNTPVRFGAALVGAAVAVPLFMLAKYGFSLYVARLVVRGTIYGTLGLLPVFLVWVNLSWMVFLFGAVLSHTVGNFGELRAAEAAEAFIQSPSARVAAAAAVARPFESGRGPVTLEDLAARLRLPAMAVERLMDRLAAIQIVSRLESPVPGYVLTRPAGRIPMTQLLEIDPHEAAPAAEEYDPQIAADIAAFRDRARGALAGWTLADFLAEKIS